MTSSVFVVMKEEISFIVSKEALRMKRWGRNHPVDRYDWDRGRKLKVTDEEGSSA